MTEYAVVLEQVRKIFDDDVQQGDFAAVDGIDLQIEKGEFFTLLGPSGCGKTTTLRLIAGFETPTEGRIIIDGKDASSVPPYKRPVHTVFQNYALFPHMTVAQNIAYGLKIAGIAREECDLRVHEALRMVQLGDLGNRKPDQLSGGQQQRVALARALVNKPAVLLLDEPLGALDLKLRKDMQLELKQLQQLTGITFIYVTHDQEEALTMSDRIAVLSEGKIIQIGTPLDVYTQPKTYFVADFIGESSFIQAEMDVHADETTTIRFAGQAYRWRGAAALETTGHTVTLAVRPQKIEVARIEDDCAYDWCIPLTVSSHTFNGSDERIEALLSDGQKIKILLRSSTRNFMETYQEGEPLWAGINCRDVSIFDR